MHSELTNLEPLLDSFFLGDKLSSEVSLHATLLEPRSSISDAEVHRWIQHIHRVSSALSLHSNAPPREDPNLFTLYRQTYSNPSELKQLVLSCPLFPDPYIALSNALSSATGRDSEYVEHSRMLLVSFIAKHYPRRLDLILAVSQSTPIAGNLHHVRKPIPAAAYYTHTTTSIGYLQQLWTSGLFSRLFAEYSNYQLVPRWFPASDYLIRCFTLLGLLDRVDILFRDIYQRHGPQLTTVSLSNIIFTSLGLEAIDQSYLALVVQSWRSASLCELGEQTPSAPLKLKPLSINERPTLAIVSADMRMHPVGRFWLPLLSCLSRSFRIVHFCHDAPESDVIYREIRGLSDQLFPFNSLDVKSISASLQAIQPDILLDLGGHTADNRPGLLSARFARLQATYLGFYGPTYAPNCDWWILDRYTANYVRNSYPGSESIWELPGPSLCFDPSSHQVPPVKDIFYSAADFPVIGSFNHTRKLTSECISRFASVLRAMPDAVLRFRSHSFFDPNIRRWFLRRLVDAGIEPNQLQPLAYAPSALDALNDYGRIHLHLDSYPVCGTTTTFDSLAMGVPVLTCPNRLYAGAISASILEYAGLAHMVCHRSEDLPDMARDLYKTYSRPSARRELATAVRSSSVCDVRMISGMFVEELTKMLKATS